MRRVVYSGLVGIANILQRSFIARPALYRLLLARPFAGMMWRFGAWRAWRSAQRAYRDVPAYRSFVDERGGPPELRQHKGMPDLSVLPETDKASYVHRYDHATRCRHGRLPLRGVVVDESSGSSGRPTSWIRGPEERWATRHMLQMSFRSALGDGSFFVINAFALGAWATGLNVTLSLNDICVMKSTGPNLDKIVHTLQEFGPDHAYVVMGYPPFLKNLADDPRVDWSAYSVRAVFGGEGISESMRQYLLRSFSEVLGSYGASDLEINMAAESPFTVGLRRELQRNAPLRERLTETSYAVLPMVFQYNPMAYHLETNAAGELVVTLARPTNVAPKIRYNIHDRGHVAPFGEVHAILQEYDLAHLATATRAVSLPLLFLYGRSDLSIDYYGANVTPDCIREILYAVDELAPCLESFRLVSRQDERQDQAMEVAIELVEGFDPARLDGVDVAGRVFARLGEVNGDFLNAYRNTAGGDRHARVSLYPWRTGPFAGGDGIKRQYVATGPAYDSL